MKRALQDAHAIPFEAVGRRPDVLLALAVTVVVGMMIIPLPGFVLDVLLAANIAASVVVLMVGLFSRNALEFTSFPSLLLISTLFRLGLNVSTTRGILAHGDAGRVVRAFGHFVLAGDLVVGMVIFLVITLVQFLVIAKGSERVAEVSARFALDAMPGKQMSIDALLRQGAITEQEAQKRREDLDRESQMFGNMDGAMKFVKGDAIAGLIITTINLLGGFAIGVARLDLSAGEAAETYSLLTVGDGLVSQISALLITVASGIVMTRVQSYDRESNLGFTLKLDLSRSGRALQVSAGVVAALAMVPGLPFVPFAIIGGLLAVLGAAGLAPRAEDGSTLRDRIDEKLKGKLEAAKGQKSLTDRLSPSVVPITLELDPVLGRALGLGGEQGDDAESELLSLCIPQLRDALYLETGVRFPGVRVRTDVADLPRSSFQIRIRDVPATAGVIDPTKVLAMTRPENLRALGLTLEPCLDPLNGSPAAFAPATAKELVEASGVVVWSTSGIVSLHLAGVLRRRAKDFLGLQEVSELMERLEKAYPALVREVVPKVISLHQILDVLRRLVDERVCIRDLKAIVEALGEHGSFENDPVWLTERVRAALCCQLVHSYAANNRLKAVLLDPVIEDTIAGGIERGRKGGSICLDPAVHRAINESVARTFGPMIRQGQRPAILTPAPIRRFVRKLIEAQFPLIPVLSFEELPSELVIHPMGRVELGEV